MTQTPNPIAAAVEPRRAAAIQRAKESMGAVIDSALSLLDSAGYDLNKVAPRPHSNMSRKQYMPLMARHNFFCSITKDANEQAANAVEEHKVDWARRRGNAPDLRVKDQDACNRAIAQAGVDASHSFDAYIAKLTAKVGAEPAVVAAELDSGALWSFSHLTIKRADGSVERWRTQMIINISILGKLFNQWPTRRVK